jgi:hypothetical protein
VLLHFNAKVVLVHKNRNSEFSYKLHWSCLILFHYRNRIWMSLGSHGLYPVCNFCSIGLATLCIIVLPTFQHILYLPFTLRMVTANYVETLEEIQDMMWLQPNNQNYKWLAICFVNVKYYKLLIEWRKENSLSGYMASVR